MSALEISVVRMSQLLAASEKARIDARFFSRAALAAHDRVTKLDHEALGSLCNAFRKGIFDIKADTYVKEGGVPFVRVGDLRNGLIDFDSVAQIPDGAHRLEHKTGLTAGDLILSKTAYPAAATVTVKECNASQDTIAAQLSAYGRSRYRSGYIVSYLNGAGRTLLGREFQGNVQEHLSLSDAARILIPRFDQGLHDAVHRLVEEANEKRLAAIRAMRSADASLVEAFGLSNWKPSGPLSYAGSSTAVAKAGRLDASHFNPAWDELRSVLKTADLLQIGEIATVNRRGMQPMYSDEGDLPVVASQNILPFGIDFDSLQRCESAMLAAADMKRCSATRGDVLIYTTGAYIGRTAPFLFSKTALASNHVNILRQSALDPAYVSAVFNSVIGRTQVSRHQRGSAQAELYPSDIALFEVPNATEQLQRTIRHSFDEAHAQRTESKRLLGVAQQAVRRAVHDSVAAAFSFLDQATAK